MNTEEIINAIEDLADTDKDAIADLSKIFHAAEAKITRIAIETETETYVLGGSVVNDYGDYWEESGTWADTWSSSSYGC